MILSKKSYFKRYLLDLKSFNPNQIFFCLRMTIKTDSQSDNQILLPDDYNPLAAIEQLETLLKFTNKAYNCLPDASKIVIFSLFWV